MKQALAQYLLSKTEKAAREQKAMNLSIQTSTPATIAVHVSQKIQQLKMYRPEFS